MEHTLLEVAKLVLSRLDLDAADRGESHYLPRCLRDELARAVEAEEAKATGQSSAASPAPTSKPR